MYTMSIADAMVITSIEYDSEFVEPDRVVLIGTEIEWEVEGRIERAIRETFPEEPNTAIAVAICESGLDQSAIGPTSDFGLMQIHEPTWDATAKELNLDYKGSIEDNLKMARHIYEVQGWNAWVCYSHNLI